MLGYILALGIVAACLTIPLSAMALTAAYDGGDVGVKPPVAVVNDLGRNDRFTDNVLLYRYDPPKVQEQRPQD